MDSQINETIEICFSREPIKIIEDKCYFVETNKMELTTDSFDRIKLVFKKFPSLYYFLIEIISPVYSIKGPLKKFIKISKGTILNLGSGNEMRRNNILNVDMLDYENVDIVCDIHQLPFKNNSIDGIMNLAVLEHVPNPSKVIDEAYRVLKPGGIIFSVIPFMQPFHASPNDFQRFTLPGIIELHKKFEIVESGVFSGPVSGFLWVFQEFIASVLSFGIPFLRNILTIFIMLVTWPIKFLDILFIYLPTAHNLASNFYILCRKR
jgi:SAM-dependent methyltransferase